MADTTPIFMLQISGTAETLGRILATFGGDVQASGLGVPSPTLTASIGQIGGTNPPAPLGAPTPDADDDNGPANTAAPAVDSAGLPWDERIHAKTKAVIADGTWRKKRGVDEGLVQSVEAELRARVPAAPPAPAAPTPPTPPAPPAPVTEQPAAPAYVPPAPTGPTPTPPAPPAPPAPVTEQPAAPVHTQPGPLAQSAAPQPPQPAPSTSEFGEFMGKVSLALQQGKIDQAYLAQLAADVGNGYNVGPLANITVLSQQPHMIPYAIQIMQHHGRWPE